MLRSVVDWSAGSLKQIRTTQCSNQSLSLVAQRCPNLEFLSINSCPNVTDSSMADIAFRCPMIRELDISYCHEVSHESGVDWEELPKSENLGTEYDELVRSIPTHWCCSGRDGNSEAAAIGKSMPNLEHLELRFSKVAAKGFALISVGCPNVEYLDLFGCVNLTRRN
ncbi:hypothetical protein DVH24_028962 [Malus domestica]|uniref:F-box domain-containing protein n=1 Tax=Malus domestica TaxID=3750 RepID=A0A498HYJ0_MALDO|nr:hypothetical protein DVH24_028962 [Malus domestica]